MDENTKENLVTEEDQITSDTENHKEDAEKSLVPKGPLNSNKVANEVIFVTSDSQNGDAKIDIENIRVAFTGLSKEELLKFTTDPFWIRIRIALFVLFWVFWVIMLVGAIAIIVMAPKCAAPEPLKWWELSPLYKIDVKSFQDGSSPQDGIGDLQGIHSKLDYISDSLGVKAIILSSILKPDDQKFEDAVVDFEDVNPVYGSLEDFTNLTTALKAKGIHLVMSLTPNHSSKKHPWFTKSENREDPYTDYYVWAKDKGLTDTGERIPPNNWKSIVNVTDTSTSAWQWSETRKEFYLRQFRDDLADLNYHNPAVVLEIKRIIKFWMDLGVSGFEIEQAQYLLEDLNLKDEVPSTRPGVTHDSYDFYTHHKTTYHSETINILDEFKKAIKNNTEDGILTVSGSILVDTLISWIGNKSHIVVDVPQNEKLFSKLNEGFTAENLMNILQTWLQLIPNGTQPNWEVSSLTGSRVSTRLSPDYVDPLNMIVMLLPGSVVTLYGEEIGLGDSEVIDSAYLKDKARTPMHWGNSTSADFSDHEPWLPLGPDADVVNVANQLNTQLSHLNVYRELVEARKAPAVMYGSINFQILESVVLTYTRIKSGHPGYLVAFNSATTPVVVDFSKVKLMSKEVAILILSSNFKSKSIKIKSKLPSNAITMNGLSSLVLTFVPTEE